MDPRSFKGRPDIDGRPSNPIDCLRDIQPSISSNSSQAQYLDYLSVHFSSTPLPQKNQASTYQSIPSFHPATKDTDETRVALMGERELEIPLEALSARFQVYLATLYSLTAITSFVLNVITVIVLWRSQKTELRKYLINLSLSDLLMSLFSIRKFDTSSSALFLAFLDQLTISTSKRSPILSTCSVDGSSQTSFVH